MSFRLFPDELQIVELGISIPQVRHDSYPGGAMGFETSLQPISLTGNFTGNFVNLRGAEPVSNARNDHFVGTSLKIP